MLRSPLILDVAGNYCGGVDGLVVELPEVDVPEEVEPGVVVLGVLLGAPAVPLSVELLLLLGVAELPMLLCVPFWLALGVVVLGVPAVPLSVEVLSLVCAPVLGVVVDCELIPLCEELLLCPVVLCAAAMAVLSARANINIKTFFIDVSPF